MISINKLSSNSLAQGVTKKLDSICMAIGSKLSNTLEKTPNKDVKPISYENFVSGIIDRGMDSFVANGPHIVMDTTDFNKIHIETLIKKINSYREEILHG